MSDDMVVRLTRRDFSRSLMRPNEWDPVRRLYAETYPIRPLLNVVDELTRALEDIARGDMTDCGCHEAAKIVLNTIKRGSR